MNKHDDKVIPTLDDVISVGDPELAQLGDINALEDDFDDEFDDAIALDTSAGDSDNDDDFEHAFDNIALAPDDEQADTEPDEIDLFDSEIEADSEASANSDDLDQSITDIIVAERFPAKESAAPAETPPAPAVEKKPVTAEAQPASSSAEKTVKTQTPKTATPEATLSPDTSPTIKTEVLISEIVDEITHQLLPEIEWKIRTRVRDILEQRLANKD